MMATSGVVTALVIVFSQLYCFQVVCDKSELLHNKAKQEQKGTDHKKTGDKEAFFAMPSSVVPPAISICIDQEIVLIYNIVLDEEERDIPQAHGKIPLGKLFLNMFRVIIAPNAP